MPWYEESFGEDYLLVYKHRDHSHAEQEIQEAASWIQLGKGEKVLDLCCGTGRHSISLAKLGLKVTGIDLSQTLLNYAIHTTRGYDIPFIRSDMRNLPFSPGQFDAVVNLFTSFGYFTKDEENRKVLLEIKRVLRPEGRFLIDFLNRDAVIRNLIPHSEREEEGTTIVEERWVEGDFVRKNITLSSLGGERNYEERVKMYTRSQMEAMMASVGLQVDEVKGDFQGKPYVKEESPRMIFTGHILR